MATPPVLTANISDGQLVLNTDLNNTSDASTGFPGSLGNMIAGVGSVNSNVSPLTVVPGSGFNIVVGGTGQWCLCQGEIADYFPATTYTLANSTSLDRYDLVCFQYAKINGSPYTTSFLSIYGAVTNGVTVYDSLRGASVQIVQGTPGAGQTATPPNGFDRVAWVKVPGSSSNIVSGDITMIMPTWAQIIAGFAPSTTNTTINGQSGNLILGSPGGTITVSGSGANINIDVTNPGISRLTSADGSIGVTAISNGYDLSAHPSGVTITSSAVYCRLRRNTNPGGGNVLSPSSSSLSPLGTPLGSMFFASGSSQCLQYEFKVKVKSGAGAQNLTGACDQIGGYVAAFLDGTVVNQLSSPAANFVWSINVPDDGNYHNIILQVQSAGGSGNIQCYWSSFVPQLNGTVDYTKFSYFGPTNANYSLP